jgi:uncharacterized protein (TIGR02246 family)
MADLEQETQKLFDRYLKAWNARDFPGVAACFSEPAMFVLPGATVSLPNRAALVEMLGKLFETLENQGFSHTTLGRISPRPSGEGMAIVDVRSVQRHRRGGSILEEIDAHYVMKSENGSWKLTVAVSCANGWRAD